MHRHSRTPRNLFPDNKTLRNISRRKFHIACNRRERGICKITVLELANRPREKLLECKNLCGLAISLSRDAENRRCRCCSLLVFFFTPPRHHRQYPVPRCAGLHGNSSESTLTGSTGSGSSGESNLFFLWDFCCFYFF